MSELTTKLSEINEQILALDEQIATVSRKLMDEDIAYNQKYYTLVLQSQKSAQPLREAEALQTCIEEGDYVRYQNLKVDAKILWNRKDLLTTYSSNLRALLIASNQE